MNMRDFAARVADQSNEGSGEVAKILRVALILLARLPADEVRRLLKRYENLSVEKEG